MIDACHETPEIAWQAINEILKRNLTDEQIGLLAAGPLETLISQHGAAFIDRVEQEARINSRFSYLLAGVWRCGMPSEIWARVQKAKKFEIISFANADELASRVASLWLDEIESANRAGKTHCVALSGGRITQKFFASTVEQAKARNISFERVHFFWADERCVSPTNSESNFKMANELLFAPLKISDSQIHRIRGEDSSEIAAKLAEAELRRIIPIASPSPRRGEGRGEEANFSSNPLTPALSPLWQGERENLQSHGLPSLDLIFLGMGEDGHVASLFPGKTEGTNPKEICCAVKNSPKPPPNRISLSYTAIAAANQVWVLASGTGKENALRESLSSSGKTPLTRVVQSRLHTKIFSDISR